MDVPETGTIVDGIGNELIILVVIFLGVMSCYFGLRTCWGATAVRELHPDVVPPVQNTRSAMGVTSSGEGIIHPENCPVCLGRLQYPVETNCGHRFCAECMLEYWRHDQWPGPARCPVCRTTVSHRNNSMHCKNMHPTR